MLSFLDQENLTTSKRCFAYGGIFGIDFIVYSHLLNDKRKVGSIEQQCKRSPYQKKKKSNARVVITFRAGISEEGQLQVHMVRFFKSFKGLIKEKKALKKNRVLDVPETRTSCFTLL